MILALLLFGSASVRIMTSASSAWGQDGQLPTTPEVATSEAKAVGEHSQKSLNPTPLMHSSALDRVEISGLIDALAKRESQVSEREKKLKMRLRALSVADEEIEKRLKKLSETESTLRATLSLADEASEKDILNLTSVYENMKPKNAAALFEEMEPHFAAGFLGRMRPDTAAQVMTALSPQAAYSISVILAGRNAAVPKS
jgi:flagellar motility protein MotE (MotC chaperone)